MASDILFSEVELRALLEREEGQFLEFKSLWDRSVASPRPLERRKARDLVAECVAAFANADSGTLLLGVEDDGTPSGHAYPDEAVADLLAVPERRLRPPLLVDASLMREEGEGIPRMFDEMGEMKVMNAICGCKTRRRRYQ
ncbi:MAG: ATP-binding protein [Chloroflexi bacterium]|nr:ATP-binding protein [Chloroflexota bacterium]